MSDSPLVTNLTDLKTKARQLADHRETQIWLLASPAEADQIAHGVVPPDLMLQAQRSMAHLQATIDSDGTSALGNSGSNSRPKRKRKE